MKHTHTILLGLALMKSAMGDGPVRADWNDYVLIAYNLTPAQETLFDRTDGRLSTFWAEWKNRRLDMVHMDPVANTTWRKEPEGWEEGINDARVNILTAWGEKGLYLLFDVVDNYFAGIVYDTCKAFFYDASGDAAVDTRNYDAVELRLCHESSYDLRQRSAELLPANARNGNPLSMAQYQLRFSDLDQQMTIFRRNPRYNPEDVDSMGWESTPEYLWQRPGLDDEAPEMGFEIELIHNGETGHYYQEWRIAWDQVGMEGGFAGPAAGDMIACLLAYTDVDAYSCGRKDRLTWKGGESFWQPKEKGLLAWGDIFFGPLLDAAEGVSTVPWKPESNVSSTPGRHHARRYTVSGRILPDGAGMKEHAGISIVHYSPHSGQRGQIRRTAILHR